MLDALVVTPDLPADLERRDPRDTLGLPEKDEAGALLDELLEELSSLQECLYAEGRRSVLLVLQGLDASGKDGTIRRVFTGVNPQGCHVTSFKAPTPVELAHDFLWRVHAHCPARGMIGIFNRSHYEDVVTVGVLGLAPEEVWRRRPERIVEFERLLTEEGTTVLKCFLHVSAEEQRERFAERLADPAKRWKHNPRDEETSRRFGEYVAAYDEALTATSTEGAPWYVIPADRNWVRNFAVAKVLVEALRRLDPQFPDAPPEQKSAQFGITGDRTDARRSNT
ncbi:MAG: polyphosphate kinase 2 family protein [Actinobacteria bacterium]|nr:polyphosphate kinase 2 family protein [Actinomycetota bacterium]